MCEDDVEEDTMRWRCSILVPPVVRFGYTSTNLQQRGRTVWIWRDDVVVDASGYVDQSDDGWDVTRAKEYIDSLSQLSTEHEVLPTAVFNAVQDTDEDVKLFSNLIVQTAPARKQVTLIPDLQVT